jgi:hypothetical protein
MERIREPRTNPKLTHDPILGWVDETKPHQSTGQIQCEIAALIYWY